MSLFCAMEQEEQAAAAQEAATGVDSVIRERSVIAPSALREALSALPSGQGFEIGALNLPLYTEGSCNVWIV